MVDLEDTTIRLKISTKKELDQIGNKGDTYDAILRKLIKKYLEPIK